MTTDVAGSINGYYKQIYLAVKELLSLKNEGSSIGIECGADIRIFDDNDKKKSIEVKFFQKQIGLYSPEIAKTIYNFYMQTPDDTMLYFNTNTKVPNQNFFLNKGNHFILKDDVAVSYVLSLLIKHECNKNKENKVKSHLKKLNFSCTECKKNPCNNCISNFVEKYKHEFPNRFTEIIKINHDVRLEIFAEKLNFIFENQSKVQSISNLKKEIKFILKKNYKNLVSNFDDLILESIIHKMAISFFDTTVINSLVKNPQADYKQHKKVSKSDVITYISTYETFFNKYEEDVLEKEIFDIIGNSNLDYHKILIKFKQEFDEYEFSKNELNEYNYATIKKYFKDNEIKFRNENERNELTERFRLYNEGFGLIGYLMSLKIKELTVNEHNIFIKGVNNEDLCIKNENYYDYEMMSKYVEYNKASGNENYNYMAFDDCSLLETICPNVQPKFMKIDKQELKISLEEYQLVNNIQDEVIEEVRNLAYSDRSILVINSALVDKKPLLNALISSIPKNKSVITIFEDSLSLPISCNNHTKIFLDSLNEETYKNNIKSLAETLSMYDKCILMIDNYNLDINNIFDNFNFFSEKSKCLVGALKRDARVYRECKNFEEICDYLTREDSCKLDMFDSIILLEHYFVDGIKRDVINIFHSKKSLH